MSPLTPPGTDQSIYYLGQIFGLVGGVLPVSEAPLLLGVLFKVINTMALILGTLMVIYVTVIGVLATAHEGEFMGKKWSGLWIPIRMVLGIVGLFPTATGYCAIQVVMMWIIVQGVGAADMLWTAALSTSAIAGSPTASLSTTPINVAVKPNLESLFKGLVCQASLLISDSGTPEYPLQHQTSDPKVSKKFFYCADNSSSNYCKLKPTDKETLLNITSGNQVSGRNIPLIAQNRPLSGSSTITYSMGPGGSCGTLTYANPIFECNKDSTSIACGAAKGQQSALQSIVLVFGTIAAQVANLDLEYLKFRFTPTDNPPKPVAWIGAYCTAKNIECCVLKNLFSAPLPGLAASPTTLCANVAQIPWHYDTAASDYSNTSKDAMTSVYYPYGFAPLNYQNFIEASVSQYTQGISGGIVSAIATQPASALKEQWQQDAQKTGWILAGAYYFKMSQETKNNLAGVNPILNVNIPQPLPDEIKSYRNNIRVVDSLISQVKASGRGAGGGGAGESLPSDYQGISGSISDASAAMAHGFFEALRPGDDNKGKDPLRRITQYGQELMKTAVITFTVVATQVAWSMGVLSLNAIIVGSGLTLNPAGEAFKTVVNVGTPFFAALLSAMFSLGALLGIYIPLIPYIIFTMGAIGWFIATIEAMVASPLIALGILSPAGQHELLGKAEPAVMIIFNLFLRPTLMVFGMMASMLLLVVVLQLINAAFENVVLNQILGGGDIGLFQQIIVIGAYVSLLTTVMNKVFSLIHVIPEKVLTWIGGQAIQYGEAEAAGEVKRGAEAAGAGAAGAGRGTGAAAEAGAEASGKAKGHDDKEKAKAGKATGS